MPKTCRPALRDLIDVVRPARPVASVYMGSSPSRPWRSRWVRLADQLRSDGAGDEVVGPIGAALHRAHAADPSAGTLVAFAGSEVPPRVFHAPGLRHLDLAWFSSPAHVLPLLAWVQERPPCVVVAVGRDAAELSTAGAGRMSLHYRGHDWREGVRSAAAAVAETLVREDVRVLVVAGEDEVVAALWAALPAPVRRDTTVRWAGTDLSPSRVEDEVRAAARTWTACVLEDFHDRGRVHRLGVEGVDDTLRALADGRVDELFVGQPEDVTATAWYGLAPTDVAPGRSAGSRHRCGLLADVAVRAALLSGTRVHVVNAGTRQTPEDGIGALCRVPLTLVRP
ncbi:hypothetical protein SK571_15425 [Lentzea sp. BCCO 10_0798]|uniref:Uncharacterized protein n=1 Tax=Lentzea kristufekii TaxID=3095430 RepID=A0ABU4TR56_9PSEU|nr:hypothetical protein [Lentzea sp. BCCO 10_0798]MDX8050779.1 hypothetical protein [Lentzea sp. BCCO 10_0798]